MHPRWSLTTLATALTFSALLAAPLSHAHGTIEKPASRNYVCGKETTPSQAKRGEGKTKECKDVFITSNDDNQGYNWMGFLSHSRGAKNALLEGKTPTENVCSFDTKALPVAPGELRVVDKPINWPTTKIAAGRNEFVWDIYPGPHFDDTEHFRHWITKPNFKFEAGKPLKWSDFESTPFCDLEYYDENPNGNPDVKPLKGEAKFSTFCTVPNRSGHHVIYSEWGRKGGNNPERPGGTDERFHACSDVVIGDAIVEPPKAKITGVTNDQPFYGTGRITVSGKESSGDRLSYHWTIHPNDESFYKIDNAAAMETTIQVLKAPPTGESKDLKITLSVTDNNKQQANASVTVKHLPPSGDFDWIEKGKDQLRDQPMKAGDVLRLRAIVDGKDHFYPENGLTLTDNTAQPAIWAYTLGKAVNAIKEAGLKVGVLSENGKTVTPKEGVNVNKIYVPKNSEVQEVHLEHKRNDTPPPDKGCRAVVRPGAGPYWAGLSVYGKGRVVLDFTGSGVDLSFLQVQSSNAPAEKVGNKLILTGVPDWAENPKGDGAYVGLSGLKGMPIKELPNMKAPSCSAQ